MRRMLAVLCATLALAIGASAQFLGYVSTQSVAQQLFTAQAANGTSVTVQNLGQSAHFLTYCNTGFLGKISFEVSPDGTFTGGQTTTIASASYGQQGSSDTGCHVLQAGGYYPTLRARVANYGGGSITAFYTALASPITFAPTAFGSNGPTAPVACDKVALINTQAQSTTVNLIQNQALSNVYICEASIGFTAATTAGTITIEETTLNNCAVNVSNMWTLQITANTPQQVPLGGPLGAFTRTTAAGDAVCVIIGAITANTMVQVSYAQY